eukprot:gene24576-26409_t
MSTINRSIISTNISSFCAAKRISILETQSTADISAKSSTFMFAYFATIEFAIATTDNATYKATFSATLPISFNDSHHISILCSLYSAEPLSIDWTIIAAKFNSY